MTVHDPLARLKPVNPELTWRQYLLEMWDRRDFAVAMPMEDLRATHSNTLLGNLWHLGNPLLNVAVYYLVFGVILSTSRGVDNFILFLTIGIFTFHLTSRSVLGGATSISSNQGLMRAIRFPRALLPISIVISRLLTFGIELGVLVAVTLATGEGVSPRWLAAPFVLGVHTALNLGGAFIAARLNAAFRDVQQIIPFLFHLLRYVSGVMFPLDRFLDGSGGEYPLIRRFVELNPMVPLIDLYRWMLMGSAIDVGSVVRLVVVSAALLVFGFGFFRGAEWRYGRA